MKEEILSPTEASVAAHIAAAKEKISDYENRLAQLPADKGPELRLPGAPPPMRNQGQERVKLEKGILEAKEAALEKIDAELKNAPASVKEKCNRSVDQWLHPEWLSPAEKKDLNQSQAFLLRNRYERELKEQSEKTLTKGDVKDMEQSERFMWQQRYKEDMPEPEPEVPGLKDEKDLDQSQEFALGLLNNGGGPGSPGIRPTIDRDRD